ncbi:ABC transporter substrate-binding protein [Aureimonas frigidaquae]|uniref:ABC transporter substrate-binding protein n=1 Tax=Aureimonas frigidaquae TaxID=424757 RepID=UPI0009F829FE|nr:ABC transporter substrate-binding protein [Aureimonas frigidaquae]
MRTNAIVRMAFAALAGAVVQPAFAQAPTDEITIVLPEQPSNLEPCGSILTDVGQVLSQNITESLTVVDPADGSVDAKLATEWSQVEPLTWRFKLREGVKFQDGEAFDAEAVKFSIDRMTSKAFTCNNLAKFGNDTITVEVIDPTTIDVTSTQPQPILPTLISVAMIVSPKTSATQATNAPIGTGPYTLAQATPERIVLERFGDYWGEEPAVAKATYVWRGESSLRIAMIQTGEADLTPTIALQDATDPSRDFSYLNSETTAVRIDMDYPPLDDARVRKALNLAIDWEGMASLFGDKALRAAQMVPPGINGHDEGLKPWTFDPDAAAELIEEARSAGVPVDTEINLIGRNGIYPNGTEAMEAMMAMWNDAGLNVKLTMLDVADWTRYLQKPFPAERGPTLLQIQHDNNKGDAAFTVPLLYRSSGSYSTLNDPALDTEIDTALAETGEERSRKFREVFGKVHDDIAADVPMFHMIGYTAVGPRIDWRPSLATNSEIPLSQIRFK